MCAQGVGIRHFNLKSTPTIHVQWIGNNGFVSTFYQIFGIVEHVSANFLHKMNARGSETEAKAQASGLRCTPVQYQLPIEELHPSSNSLAEDARDHEELRIRLADSPESEFSFFLHVCTTRLQ